MKISEVCETLDRMSGKCVDGTKCEKYPYCAECDALQSAIDLISYRVPKPIIFTSMNYGTVTCSRCQKPINLDGFAITEEWKEENQFCRHCGQRLNLNGELD